MKITASEVKNVKIKKKINYLESLFGKINNFDNKRWQKL